MRDLYEKNELGPTRVLHIVGVMHPGGLENFIMNLYDKIDKEKFQFDVVVHSRQENDYVEKIQEMGGKVYEVPRLTHKPIENLKRIYKIVKENKYKIVIRHTPNALVIPQLYVAKLAGAKTICHSHNETDPLRILHQLGRLMMNIAVVDRMACSTAAGRWMFGRRDFKIVKNAIDIKKFEYEVEKENDIREEFQIGKRKVYGHIANFIESKNHTYLLKIFKEIAILDAEAMFFCVGEGQLRPIIEKEIEELNLKDRVILTGSRNDVEKFMSCFDVLIFPSIFEGLPLTLIEAQSAGLPCLISDTITEEVIVTKGLVAYMSINEKPEVWAKKAIDIASVEKKDEKRKSQHESIKEAGYDMEALAKWYEAYFDEMRT